MSTIKMQRVVNGKVQVRHMPAHLATSSAAKMGGWLPVQALAIPVPPVVAPVTPQDEPKADPVERPAVAVASAEEQPAPRKRGRPRITKPLTDDASNA